MNILEGVQRVRTHSPFNLKDEWVLFCSSPHLFADDSYLPRHMAYVSETSVLKKKKKSAV